MEQKNFSELGISEAIQKAVNDIGYEEATTIQSMAIPLILEGKDVIGLSQTGSGKTAAFSIPAIEMIEDGSSRKPQVLIVCPTRELAIQASEEIRKFSKYREGIKTAPIYGGQPIDRQIRFLKTGSAIVVGTPGRLMDLMRRNVLKLDQVKMVILDEADEMLTMGFKEDIETILKEVPEERQTILFSATMSAQIMKIAKKFQKDPAQLKPMHQQLTVPTIDQYYFEVPRGAKIDVLCNALDVYNPTRSIVFCNTKRQVEELQSELQSRGYLAVGLHGDIRQSSRTQILNSFKSGNNDILIATDVAARGIDVDDVEIVFNYDIPQDEEYYVHRIGRTGRAGKHGEAYTFVVGKKQIYALNEIRRFTGKNIKLKAIPTNDDIFETKQNKLIEDIKEILEKGKDLSKYTAVIDYLMEENYTTIDIASALIKMKLKVKKKNNPLLTKENMSRPHSDENMVTFKVNIGTSNGISVNNILSAVANATGLSGKVIGKITVNDKVSYFDVPAEEAERVETAMVNATIKGRRIKAVLSERKPDRRPPRKRRR